MIDLKKYVVAAHDPTGASILTGWKAGLRAGWSLMGVGQETILTFLLFWIGFYVSSCPGGPFRGVMVVVLVLTLRLDLLPRRTRLLFMVCHIKPHSLYKNPR